MFKIRKWEFKLVEQPKPEGRFYIKKKKKLCHLRGSTSQRANSVKIMFSVLLHSAHCVKQWWVFCVMLKNELIEEHTETTLSVQGWCLIFILFTPNNYKQYYNKTLLKHLFVFLHLTKGKSFTLYYLGDSLYATRTADSVLRVAHIPIL